jgi:hypothetical protein
MTFRQLDLLPSSGDEGGRHLLPLACGEFYEGTDGSNTCVTFVILTSHFSYFIKSPILHLCCNICFVIQTSFSGP